ncbi:MAG: cell division protein ZapE [Alphaproteobacteria bacterium]|nr:cell division protein ZapE [Alphaproteobacteria bacterium]
MSEGPLFAYRQLVRDGALQPDSIQELAAEKLQSLCRALANYQPAGGISGWKAVLGLARRREDPPLGLYLYGPVGRGKSMLMDLFVAAAPLERKRRVHFHQFMIEVHGALHRWRKAQKTSGDREDPIDLVADAIAGDVTLLCFDELEVRDIADAMILGRLFEALFERGVVMVCTTNIAPDDLYKDGLQRALFLPFIEIIKQKLDLLELSAQKDYRQARLEGREVWHAPLGDGATAALDRLFADLTDGVEAVPEELTVKSRIVKIPAAARGVARFHFDDLCRAALGAEDYLTIARHYRMVLIDGIPVMDETMRNESRRFITLIDALYENHTRLAASAAAAPDELVIGKTHAQEYKRTASRLAEMRSAGWGERRPGPG